MHASRPCLLCAMALFGAALVLNGCGGHKPKPGPSPPPTPTPFVPRPSSGLGWQAHSFNDLRLWPQLAMKSVRQMLSVKVDPHDFTSANGFRLTHDDPVEGVDYNTTEQLLVETERILKGWPSLAMRIAVCFKQGANACEGTEDLWLAAVDGFFQRAESLVAKFPGRLEFVLDGNAKPMSCLKDRWRPWNATWIPFDKSPPEAEYSNNVTESYDRFAVLNPKVDDAEWAQLRSVNYGKFLTGLYPFQLWEPSSQEIILAYASNFTKGPFVSNPHLGFDYAINMDPAMFSVFTASQTNHQAWNMELPLQECTASRTSEPFLVTLGELNDMLLVLYTGDGDSFLWSTFRASSPFGKLSALKCGSLSAHFPAGQSHLVALVSANSEDSHDYTHFYVVTESYFTRGTVAADGTLSIQVNSEAIGSTALAARFNSRAGSVMFLVLGRTPGTLDIKDPHSSDMDANWTTPVFPGHGLIASADFLMFGQHIYLVTASNGTHVFVTTSRNSHWKLLDVGASVSLSSTSNSAGGAVVALTSDGGFCWNSEKHNKQAAVKVCDQSPTPCTLALDYTVGAYSQWQAFVESPELASPCTELLHGTYDFGATPSSALVTMPDGKIALWAVHAGLTDSNDHCDCGSVSGGQLALARPGKLVLDGFIVNDPESLPSKAFQTRIYTV